MNQSILIVKLSSFGDVIHALPTLEALRTLYPEARLTWLVEEACAPLLTGHPALDEVWAVPRLRFQRRSFGRQAASLARMGRRLRAQPFDLVIDLQGLLKSAIWVALAQSSRKLGYNSSREGSHLALTEKLPPYDPEAHAVQRYLNVVRYLGAPETTPLFRLEHLLETSGQSTAAMVHKPYVVLHPGARWQTKLWSAAAWARLAEWLAGRNLTVALTGSAADQGLADAILEQSRAPITNLAGRTSMGQLAALLKEAALAVTTDTGPMHLAAALGTPVAALFGPTAPWRTGPFGPGHEVVRLGLECSPCFQRRCPEPRCLTELPTAAAERACEKILSRVIRD